MGQFPLVNVQVDIEFLNKFTKDVNYFGVKFRPAPALRDKTLGALECKNSVIIILIHKLLHDAEYAKETQNVNLGLTKVLYIATYLSNMLYGENLLSSFEMWRV